MAYNADVNVNYIVLYFFIIQLPVVNNMTWTIADDEIVYIWAKIN